MLHHTSFRRASWPLLFSAAALATVAGCGVGDALVNGKNPFAAQSGASSPMAATDTSGSPAGTVGNANSVSSGSQGSSVGVEVDTQGGAVDLAFWSGSLAAVGALSPNAPLAARVVVGTYSNRTVALAYQDDGTNNLPTGRDGITFANDNGTEALLNELDQQNVAVLVELQPGAVNLPTLAAAVLQHYKSHKSVVGVSINLYYYGSSSSNVGDTHLADADANALVAAVQAVSSTAIVYLRSYTTDYMPPSARTGLGFTLDASGFNSLAGMTQDYSTWAQTFAPAPVQFVTGGSKDKSWACALSGGPGDLLSAAAEVGSNVNSVMWSADTVAQLYPSNVFSCLAGNN